MPGDGVPRAAGHKALAAAWGSCGAMLPWDEGAPDVWPFPALCPQLLEDLEEQLYCSAFEEAALTHRICSELQLSSAGMARAWPWAVPWDQRAVSCLLPSDPTSCWLPLDMELLHRQVLALQTQRILLGMWLERMWRA